MAINVLIAAAVIFAVLLVHMLLTSASPNPKDVATPIAPIAAPYTSAAAPINPAPAPVPAVAEATPDPLRDGWQGSFLLHTRANVASILVNGETIFVTSRAGTYLTPPTTLRQKDLVVFEVTAPSDVIRAAFLTADGKQQIALRAVDLREFDDTTPTSSSDLTAQKILPAALPKVSEVEVNEWEHSGARPVPHGSDFVKGKNADTYRVGFVVSAAMFRPLRASSLPDRMSFLFDDPPRTAANWKWKANFTMNADGATGPAEPDNELVSRFMLDGDFAVDLDADFGRAAYTNTGGMNVTVCGQEIGFDGGWNFGSWQRCSVHIRVQRLGDELQLIRDGQVLIVAVPDSERDKPTNWRLWWRSRSSHFHGIKVAADRIIDPDGRRRVNAQ